MLPVHIEAGLATFGIEVLGKATVLLLLACLATGLCRRTSAALRHALWLGALIGLAALPIAAILLPAWRLPILADSVLVTPQAVSQDRRSVAINRHDRSIETAGPLESESQPERPVRTFQAGPDPIIPRVTTRQEVNDAGFALYIAVVWLLGVLLFTSCVVGGQLRAARLRHSSTPVRDERLLGMFRTLCERSPVRGRVELREHVGTMIPLTFGVLRPVVLLPRLAGAWSESMQVSVLLHELAHVRRHDVLTNLLSQIACAIYWFHPLAWRAFRKQREERERACDDVVVRFGVAASDYAGHLLSVARKCSAQPRPSQSVAIAAASSLEDRVRSLFDDSRSHGAIRTRTLIWLPLVGVLTLGALAATEPGVASISADDVPSDVAEGRSTRQVEGIQTGGVVVDGEGRPVSGALVVIEVSFDRSTGKQRTLVTTSDDEGRFRFAFDSRLLDETRQVALRSVWGWKEGHAIGTALARTFDLEWNQSTRLTLPAMDRLACRVLGPEGRPVSGAFVSPNLMGILNGRLGAVDRFAYLDRVPEEIREHARTPTDVDGRAVVECARRSDVFTICVESEHFGRQELSLPQDDSGNPRIEPNPSTVDIRLLEVGSIEGVLLGAGEPTWLMLHYSGRDGSGIGGDRVLAVDDEGRFECPAFPVGPATIHGGLTGPRFIRQTRVHIHPGENKLVLDTITGVPVKGRLVVRDADRGVPNARLSVRSVTKQGSRSSADAVTDTNGRFLSSAVPGRNVLQVTFVERDELAVKLPWTISFSIPPDVTEFTIPDIELEPVTLWRGRVVDQSNRPIQGAYVVAIQGGWILNRGARTNAQGEFKTILNLDTTPNAWRIEWRKDGVEVKRADAVILAAEPLLLRVEGGDSDGNDSSRR